MSMQIGDVFVPPTTWWTIQQELELSPGEWADLNGRYYSEGDANDKAMALARLNFSAHRVVKHN